METLEKQRRETAADPTSARISPASDTENVSLPNGNPVYSGEHHHSHSGEHHHSEGHHSHSGEHHHSGRRRRSRSDLRLSVRKLFSNKVFCVLLGIFMTALLAFLFVLFLYIGSLAEI